MTKFLLTSFLLFFGFAGFSQTEKITGKITGSDDGATLPGVAIYIKGTTTGTITDSQGLFSIEAKKGETLVVSHIGYEGIEMVVGDQTDLNIVLQVKVSTLNEIVVIGYGTSSKRDLTGSASSLNFSDQVNPATYRSPDAPLQGKIPGAQIIQSNGVLGSAVRVRVRGQNSFTGSGDPLYVVDGMPIYSGDFSSTSNNSVSAANSNVLSTINPADIESIDVLKDAAASAIYGARAANGVVVITTKKGKSGATKFDVGYSVGQSKETHRLKLISAQEWWTLYNEARVNDGNLPIDPAATITISGVPFKYDDLKDVNTDWLDEILQKGSSQNLRLTARGGNEKTQFYVGGGYKNEDGILKGNSFEAINARVNIDNQATQNFKFGTQSSISYTNNQQVPTSFNGGIGAAQSTALRIFPVYNSDGSYYGTQISPTPNTGANPVARLLNKYSTKSTRFINNVYADLKITSDLSFRAEYGLDILDQFEERYDDATNRYYKATSLPAIGLAARWERRLTVTNQNANAYFTYNKTFGQHNLVLTVGSALQNSVSKGLGLAPFDGSVGFLNNYYTQTTRNMVVAPGSAATTPVTGFNERDTYRFLSFFTRANYKFKDKYLVGASFRADGSSRFGPNNRIGYFPAISAGWILSEEGFMQGTSFVNFLKLRASYGATGNSEIGNFRYLGTFSTVNGAYLGTPGITPTRLANPDLSWEKAKQIDIGLEFKLFQNRLSGSVGFYRKISTDVLLDKPAPTSATGLGTLLYNADNVKVRNAGIELELTGNVMTKGDFTWNADFNISGNRNEVLETGGIPPDGFGAGAGDTRVIKGYPIGISYLAISAGVNPETGNEMVYQLDGTIIDATKQSDITSNRQPVGHPFPNFFGGLNNTLRYKNFDLSFLFYFSQGNKIYDDGAKRQMGGFLGTWNQRPEVLNRWQKPGDETNIPRLTLTGASFAGSDRNTSRYLFDASYVRLRNISFGYSLPLALIQKLKLSNAHIYVTGTNLLTFTKYKGWDPEVTRAFGSAAESNISFDAPYLPTPQVKSVLFGIDISF